MVRYNISAFCSCKELTDKRVGSLPFYDWLITQSVQIMSIQSDKCPFISHHWASALQLPLSLNASQWLWQWIHELSGPIQSQLCPSRVSLGNKCCNSREGDILTVVWHCVTSQSATKTHRCWCTVDVRHYCDSRHFILICYMTVFQDQ